MMMIVEKKWKICLWSGGKGDWNKMLLEKEPGSWGKWDQIFGTKLLKKDLQIQT